MGIVVDTLAKSYGSGGAMVESKSRAEYQTRNEIEDEIDLVKVELM